MKLWKKVIKLRLRKETRVTDNNFGFVLERSAMEAIYLLRRVIERYRTNKKDLHLVSLIWKKVCDIVPIKTICEKPREERG